MALGRVLSWDGSTGEAIATLEGHTGAVYGALCLDDSRILSWSEDNTLRLWDGATGEAIATLEGHRKMVAGALCLDDGRILSSSLDGTLRLWDGATGEAIGCWLGVDAPHTVPDLWCAMQAHRNPKLIFGPATGGCEAGEPDLLIGAAVATWHGDGQRNACGLLGHGVLITYIGKDLAFLQLHHGTRRVTIGEAAALLGLDPDS
jgi:WD40 repeat protein